MEVEESDDSEDNGSDDGLEDDDEGEGERIRRSHRPRKPTTRN